MLKHAAQVLTSYIYQLKLYLENFQNNEWQSPQLPQQLN